ncbi:hypothetical protein ACQKP5_22885 [Pseudomonas vancouverensis]|uniref:hypothetical protein n=1 Tax=Pseudomonas vancouverensis TaxID=95300 RepID=UPI003D07B9D2
MALIGHGSQGEFQTIAFHTMLGIIEIRLFDIDTRVKNARRLTGYRVLAWRERWDQHSGFTEKTRMILQHRQYRTPAS